MNEKLSENKDILVPVIKTPLAINKQKRTLVPDLKTVPAIKKIATVQE